MLEEVSSKKVEQDAVGSARMKFNIKNRPKFHHITDMQRWFEGFEAELRRMQTGGVYESDFDRRLIEQILGEEQ